MIARIAIALVAGILFGVGLAFSGMIDPMRVRAFLDPFGGAWDPTLGFVMAGAVLPMAFAWLVQRHMQRPFLATAFSLPDTRIIDRRLLAGAMLFGIGWGLAGLCPGPAIADLALRPRQAAIFVAAMLSGFAMHAIASRLRHVPRASRRG
ncbi:DUF6691 family protein [Sphingomonas oryzagri]